MTAPVFRFAPSPNGYLHLGHALSAVLNADMARAAAGRLLLRIEDIDTTRCRPEFEAAIYEDLAWLGIAWEEPVRRQSDRLDDYRAAIARLGPMGETGVITAAPQAWGDIVLARKDTPTSYHLSVVIDDAAQGVTQVVRGADLFWATSLHRLLQELLGLPFPIYHHHRLILGPDG